MSTSSVSTLPFDLSSLVQQCDPEDFVTARLVVDCHCILGEGILYDDRRQAVLWTDIMGSKLHELRLVDSSSQQIQHVTYTLPRKLCSFGLLNQPSSVDELPLLCAWEDGFQLYDVAQGKELSDYSEGEDVNPKKLPTRLNDGRVDPAGTYYICGGYYGDVPGNKMKVYRVAEKDGNLTHTPIVDSIEVTNSIHWTPDGRTMYLADSPTRSIQTYEYSDGVISNPQPFHSKPEEDAVPDGSCVDAEGYLWNAVWRSGMGPGMVQRIDPITGTVVFTVHMPDTTSQCSCCCFGGPDLDILFITTAHEHRDVAKEPHAGGLYAVKLPFKGKLESRFRGSS